MPLKDLFEDINQQVVDFIDKLDEKVAIEEEKRGLKEQGKELEFEEI